MPKTYYEILNISETATQEEIKIAFKTLAKQYHPDNNLGNEKESENRMKEITEAYVVLSDLEKRKQYDIELKRSGFTGFAVKRESSYQPTYSYASYTESTENSEYDFDDYIKIYLKKYREYFNNQHSRIIKENYIDLDDYYIISGIYDNILRHAEIVNDFNCNSCGLNSDSKKRQYNKKLSK